jgi:hypothetical protein
MTVAQRRVALKKAYPGTKWADRVDQMSDEQVVAVYIRLQQQKKL